MTERLRHRLAMLQAGIARRRRRLAAPVLHHVLVGAGTLRRRARPDLTVVGITGSGGKSTAKELLAAVLHVRGPVRRNPTSLNRATTVARTILSADASTWALVQELGANGPGSLDTLLRLLRPNVGLVTTVGLDHFRRFRTREAVAAEKGKLVAALPADGVAVLNADDPHVAAMAARARARVVTFGFGPEADVRGEDPAGRWPERFSLRVSASGRSVLVRTRLCGAHWSPVVLGAIAAGTALGISLEDAAAAVGDVEPLRGRMSVEEMPDGVTFVRDDWKAPFGSLENVFRFLENARAERKVLVVGTLSDYGGDSARKYRQAARRALEVADLVVFVGRWAGRVERLAAAVVGGRLLAFPTIRAASRHLDVSLRAGDLVVLKGSATADHLGRLALARQGRIACWRERCGRQDLCESCRLRMVPGGA